MKKNAKFFTFWAFLAISSKKMKNFWKFFGYLNFFLYLCRRFRKTNMEQVNKTSESQAILLIWKEREENDALKYELFKRTTVLFRKYGRKQLGISQGTLNNFICNSTDDSVVYENKIVCIIRTKLYSISDFPPTEEEKIANRAKVLRRKNKEAI